jgi:hypothetical protein
MNRTPLSWFMDNLDEEKFGENRFLVIVNDQAKAPSKTLLRRSKEREANRRNCTSSGIFISSSPDRPQALDRHANPSERSSESTLIMSPSSRNVIENPKNPDPLSFESPCSVLITDPSSLHEWPDMTTADCQRIGVTPGIRNKMEVLKELTQSRAQSQHWSKVTLCE